MEHQAINLNISYNQTLDIQLFIQHQLNSQNFKRHWILCKGFDSTQENKFLKTYLGFLSQGDIYRIKTSNFSSRWKQKTLQVNFNSPNVVISTRKNKYEIDLEQQFLQIQDQVQQNQYDQFFVITVFLSQSLSKQEFLEFYQTLLGLQNSGFLLNVFVPEEYVQQLISPKAWVRLYSAQQMREQMRDLFISMNRISFKKITVKLKCLDGDIVMNQNSQIIQKSHWQGQGQTIFNNIYFPSCNSPYIMSVQMKNMLKSDICTFQIELICQDYSGITTNQIKTFSMKPKRQFLDWTDCKDTRNGGPRMYKCQQLSLNFQQVNLNQKLNYMKIYGTPGRVLLKGHCQV